MSMKKLLLAGGAAALMMGSTAYASIIDRPFFKVLGVVVVWGADSMDGTTPVVSDFVLLTPATGLAGADLIAADGATVVTGTLNAISATGDNEQAGATVTDPVTGTGSGTFVDDGNGVLDANDTLTAFGIDATTDVGAGMIQEHTSSFYVASNAPFDISAHADPADFIATGDFASGATQLTPANISYDMTITVAGGGTAEEPLAFGANATSPGTTLATNADLTDFAAPALAFEGVSRTALTRGNLAAQSVRFDNTYTLDDGTGLGYDLSMGAGTVQADMVFTIFVP